MRHRTVPVALTRVHVPKSEGKASDVFQMEAQASGAPREDSIWPGAVPLGEIPWQAAGLGLTEQGAGQLWGARG